MSNKAITTNDLKAVLDVVLPPQPSEYRKLLWTNPSPNSGFAAQTISLDLSEYDEVEIECLASAGGTDFVTERCLIGKATMAQFVSGGNGYGSGTPFLTERRFATSTSGITASTGYGCFTGGSDWSYNSTTRMIPIYIYGIKYERVNPPQVEIADVVVEQGSTTVGSINWTYRKWESGIAECWAATPATSKTVSTSYGAGYYAPRDNFSLPSGLFTSISEAQASLRDSNAIGTWFSLQNVSTTEIGGYIFSLTSNTITVQLNIHAIGLWK